MEQRLLHTPEGVRDIYSGEYARKKALLQKLHRVVEGYGYCDIETPTFEYFGDRLHRLRPRESGHR